MKKVTFEIELEPDKALQSKALERIKSITKKQPRRLYNAGEDNDESDFYVLNLWTMDEKRCWDIAQKVSSIEGVIDVDADIPIAGSTLPDIEEESDKIVDDEQPDPCWFHKNIQIKEAIDYVVNHPKSAYTGGESGIKMAQLDTGYTNHPEIFKVRKELGYNYVFTIWDRIVSFFTGKKIERDPKDRLRNFKPFKWASHGTATASVIVGEHTHNGDIEGDLKDLNNGIFPHVDLVPFRISETIISFNNKAGHAAMQAMKDGCKIITMSHAGLLNKRSWRKAVKEAYKKGVIWVAAGGSHLPNGKKIWVYPARYPETIATAASKHDDTAWTGTFEGKEIDISAPGYQIYIPYSRKLNQYSYRWSEGTSFSTPIVAASAALWLAFHGEEKLNKLYTEGWQRVEAFRYVLKKSAFVPEDWEKDKYGAGILRVKDMMEIELPKKEDLSPVSDIKTEQTKIDKVKEKENIAMKEITFLTCKYKSTHADANDEGLYKYVHGHICESNKAFLSELVEMESSDQEKGEKIKQGIKAFTNEFNQ